MENRFCLLLLVILVCFSCDETYSPKPKAFLRLDYPKANYVEAKVNLPFSFETNLLATKLTTKKGLSTTGSYGVNIEYPSLKGTIFLTYKAIDGSKENLKKFILDAEKFTLEHAKKADGILPEEYININNNAFGMLYDISGNVASQHQFYVTDSVNHFLRGSLYFKTKPNHDSILPAANYIKKDIQHIMETIKWK